METLATEEIESPFWMMMVAALAVLMTTLAPLVGTWPVLQLLPTSQLPPVGLIQFTVAGAQHAFFQDFQPQPPKPAGPVRTTGSATTVFFRMHASHGDLPSISRSVSSGSFAS